MDIVSIDKKKISVTYQLAGFLFFGTLVFLSIYYYKERMILFDGAFYDFRLVTEGFNWGPERYADIIGELLPWLAIKMGASLPIVIACHSAGLMIFHYTIFLIITIRLKNNGAGLAVMLASCIAYAHAFYLPMEQVNEVLVLGVLLWAIIHPEQPYPTERAKNMATIWALLTIVLMTFFHPLCIFIIAFVVGVEATAFRRYRDKQLWIIGLVGLAWVELKFQVIFVNKYEQDKIVPLSTILHQIKGFQDWPSTIYVLKLITFRFRTLKWVGIICLLFSLRKSIMLFLFTILITAGFTIIFLGTFYKGASVLVYEEYFTIYGFFIAILFCSLFYAPQRKNLMLLICIPLLWAGTKKINYSHYQFTYRNDYLARIIKAARDNHEQKCFIDNNCYPGNYADAPWDVAFETLLYSSLQGPDSSVTIFIKNPSFDSLINANKAKANILFGVQFSPLWYTSDHIPSKYFRLTSSGYSHLTHLQEDSSFHPESISPGDIKLIPMQLVIHAKQYDWLVVAPIKIINNSGITIPAIPGNKRGLEINYSIYSEKGENIGSYIPTPFETDVKKESETGLIIYPPFQPGIYFVRPDIVTSDGTHLNVSCPIITLIMD